MTRSNRFKNMNTSNDKTRKERPKCITKPDVQTLKLIFKRN